MWPADLVPIEPDGAWIDRLRASLPELPATRRARLEADQGLTVEQAAFVGASSESLGYFDQLLARGVAPRDAAVWMSGELARSLNTAGIPIEQARVSPEGLAKLIALVHDETINLNTAKKVFSDAFGSGKDPAALVAERGLAQVSDESAIRSVVDDVLAENAAMVERYHAGEEKVFNALFGQVMKALKGQGKPDAVQHVLREALAG